MKRLMGILGMITPLLGTSCSKNTVHVEFINAKDNSLIAVSEIPTEQLPDSFAINTTLELKESKWSVVSADPIEKSKFVQTGKLKVVLSPITMIPPGDILFSLASISDDVGGVVGATLPNEKILALHEDDWRQVEFVSQNFAPEIEQEFRDIQRIYQSERVGIGFKNVHIRKRIPNPLKNQTIALSELETVIRPQGKFDAVGFQRTRGTIPHSFAWKLDASAILWGVTDSDGSIARLCVYGSPETNNVAQISEACALLNSRYKLVFVDWCRITNIVSDPQAFSNYFRRGQ